MLTQLPGSPGCFICDNNGSNPRALALKLQYDEETHTVRVPCTPDQTWCGYSNVVHGGLVATVMDEAMAWAVKLHSGEWAFTADYRVRYKKAVEPGRNYTATAVVLEDASRTLPAEASFLDSNGKVVAKASATFLPSKGKARPRTSD